MIQREKRYVEVDVRFSTEGRLRPLQIIYDKGQVYKIDKIKDICRRAADVGGVGDRYTCMIQGKERVFFEILLLRRDLSRVFSSRKCNFKIII